MLPFAAYMSSPFKQVIGGPKAYHKRSWPCLGGGDYLNRFVGIANTGRPHPVSADGTAFDIHASTLKPVTLPEDVSQSCVRREKTREATKAT